jgi:crotonobetainyl-CoA:carnitine CoA-transferase CaiB-like acyl-CoA transferase
MEQLEANDVPYTPVYNLAEVFQDPQIQHMGLEIKIDRKSKPTIKTVKFPVEYSVDKCQHPIPPPDLGEHNSEFLKSLGYDEKAVDALKEKGVI